MPTLRNVIDDDLDVFFEDQQDAEARWMAAFVPGDPTDRTAFDAHWRRIGSDRGIVARSVIVDDEVAGHVIAFDADGRREVTYWIGRAFWGRGVATAALQALLAECPERPLYARAASDNVASRRVLEKCGFTTLAHERGFADARRAEIDELVLVLH